MKKLHAYQVIRTIYILVGILFISVVENNMAFGVLAVICFIGAHGYDTLANEETTRLENDLYEHTY